MAAKERQKHKPKSVVENLPPQDKARAVKAALKHPNGAKMSDRQIAEHVGVGNNMVSRYRREIEDDCANSTVERTGCDGRTINTTIRKT